MRKFASVATGLECVPTFAITAVTLKRHPAIIRELGRGGVEFAIHGYIHIDYGVVPPEEQAMHFDKAMDTFKDCQVPFTGFRAPFLRTNGETLEVLSKLGFSYDSSCSTHWNVLDSARYPAESWREYERLLEFYLSKNADDYPALPRFCDGLVEIPVSIPDDEAMVERLGITHRREISAVWRDVLQKTYERGELFTLQLHPERISICETALADTVRQARRFNPPVWVAPLKEIAAWWKEKNGFLFEIIDESHGSFRVKATCSDRATILIKNCAVNTSSGKWSNGYQVVDKREFVLESPVRPVIGMCRNASPSALKCLQNSGYIVERSEQPGDYGIYLDNLERFNEADEKPLLEQLERSEAPLLRYGNWPGGTRSALSVTGDIDAMTLIDFALRIKENWSQTRKNPVKGYGTRREVSIQEVS